MRLNYTPLFKSLRLSPGQKESFKVNTCSRNIKLLPLPPKEKRGTLYMDFTLMVSFSLVPLLLFRSLQKKKGVGRYKFWIITQLSQSVLIEKN